VASNVGPAYALSAKRVAPTVGSCFIELPYRKRGHVASTLSCCVRSAIAGVATSGWFPVQLDLADSRYGAEESGQIGLIYARKATEHAETA
jgi:hypothetical protein